MRRRLVMVEWEDAGARPGWTADADIDTSALICRSVGWLVRSNPVVLAQTDGEGEWNGLFQIPKRMVLRIIDLQEPKCSS